MSDPVVAGDIVDGAAKAGAGGFLVGLVAWLTSWFRHERQADKDEAARREAAAAEARRHDEALKAIAALATTLVGGMAEQSKAQLAGIQAAAASQSAGFSEAGARVLAAVEAKLDALAVQLAEAKTDVRELRHEVAALRSRD